MLFLVGLNIEAGSDLPQTKKAYSVWPIVCVVILSSYGVPTLAATLPIGCQQFSYVSIRLFCGSLSDYEFQERDRSNTNITDDGVNYRSNRPDGYPRQSHLICAQ